MRKLYVLLILLIVTGLVYSQVNFSQSLHGTRSGKAYWYNADTSVTKAPKPGFESLTNIPITGLGCVECHGPTDANGNAYGDPYSPGCTDCHPTGNFSPDVMDVNQCYSCHGRQKTEALAMGLPDVHRDAGMKCWDCHTKQDMHGPDDSNVVFKSMLEAGAIEADCETCHVDDLISVHT